MKSILWKVAKEHHTTEEEVRSAIDEAIAIAMQNEDPAVKSSLGQHSQKRSCSDCRGVYSVGGFADKQ